MKQFIHFTHLIPRVQTVMTEASGTKDAAAGTAASLDLADILPLMVFLWIITALILAAMDVLLILLLLRQRSLVELLSAVRKSMTGVLQKIEEIQVSGDQNDSRAEKTPRLSFCESEMQAHTELSLETELKQPDNGINQDAHKKETGSYREPVKAEKTFLHKVAVNDSIHYNPQAIIKFDIQDNGNAMFRLYSDNTLEPDPKCLLAYNFPAFYNRYDFPAVFRFQDEYGKEVSMERQVHIVKVLYPAKVSCSKGIVLKEKGILIVEEK